MTDTYTTAHIPDEAVQAAMDEVHVYGYVPDRNDFLNMKSAIAAALPHLSVPCAVEAKEGEEEKRIDELRRQAFMTNSEVDRQAYFDAASKWFQDRHFRYMEAKPVDVAAVREQCAKLCDQSAALSAEQAENTMNPAVKCTLMGEAASARSLAKQIRALSADPARPSPDFAKSIAYVIKEESLGGAACGWRSCSGCLETSEGHLCGDYPYSDLFKAHVGFGCSDCGGLGVVWEYYSKSCLDEMQRELKDAEPAHGEKWQPIETAPKDGTWILAFYHKDCVPAVIFYDNEWKRWAGCADIGSNHFTHWMPLPAAPTTEAVK